MFGWSFRPNAQPRPVSRLIERHFRPYRPEDLVVWERHFPVRARADLQRGIDSLLDTDVTVSHFCGVRKTFAHEGLTFSALLAHQQHDPALCAPPEYEEIDVGEQQPVRALKTGLWLLRTEKVRCAFFVAPASKFSAFGQVAGRLFQVVLVNSPEAMHHGEACLKRLEDAVQRGRSYRGKVLSLELEQPFSGEASDIVVHKLPSVERHQVILPQATLDLLDRNVIRFADQRQRLSGLRQPVKKGILFYGPPGTGKTHTIHYLARALPGHTTLLITAEQVGLLSEYMALARLLQPSLVVVEDVDLIARERTEMDACRQALLHRLLNEMDGLREDAEVMFLLTTNRPELLETALASRPGRIDQAIEFPLPDAEGREKLIRLYSEGIDLPDELVQAVVRKTDKVSGAFIRELMRRSVQFHLERSEQASIDVEDVEGALEEMLFRGGSLNLKLLGAQERIAGFAPGTQESP